MSKRELNRSHRSQSSQSTTSSCSRTTEPESPVQFLEKQFRIINEKIDEIRREQKKCNDCQKNAMGRLAEEIVLLRKEQNKRFCTIVPFDDRVLPASPYEDCIDFAAFEEKLRDSEFFKIVVRELACTSASGPQSFVRKAWRTLISDSVAKEFSWSGRNSKKSVKYLISTAAIKGAFQITYKSSPIASVDEETKKFFNYANDRIMKRKTYQSRKNKENK